MFLDDIYLSRGAAQAFELFDIERVEVLRGPQGTLYGKNVVGGVMNVITAKPSDEFAAKGELSFGNYDAITAKAMLNGGLTETLSARVSAVVQDRDGYARNIVTGDDLEDRQFFGIRGQLRWQPNENIDFILAADYSDHEDNGLSRKGQGPFGSTPFGTVTAVQTTDDPRESESPRDSFQERELWGVSARLDAEIGIGTLTSLTAYRESDVNLSDAFTGIGSPPFPVLDTANIEIEKAEQFSQEFRLAFQPFDWLNTIAGVYYLNEDVNRTEIADLESVLGTMLPNVLGSLTGTSGSFQLATNESLGLFVNATIDFTDQLSAVIGGRYSKDWKDVNTRVESLRDVGCCIAAPPTEEYDISAKESWDAFTPSFTLQYAASEDINLYGTVSRGFKSGGFQGQAPTGAAAETPFNPEFAWNYELGAKTDWFDRRLTFNVALFYTEYSDLQVRQNSTRPGETIPILRITNAADAEVKGVEIEWSATPIPELMVWGSYSYLDSKFQNFIDNNGVDVSGNRMQFAPEHKFDIGGRVTLPVTDSIEGFAQLQYSWQDDYFTEPGNAPVHLIDSYGLLNASAGVSFDEGRWRIELWGKNLNNALYEVHIIPFLGDRFATFGAPRTYGGRVAFTW